ncbi:MAG TPA: peptidase, partial [Ferruginibacter sp.]|nr:peptidase [Ferruginibacter sp.]
MKKIYQFSLLVLFVMITTSGFAQSDRFWSANTQIRSSITTDKAVARVAFPKEFKLFNLNIAPLRNELFKVVDNQSMHSTVISLPNADGQFEQFEVYEASNFVPELQARYPEIR